ncbi:MAG: hypothetical protein RL380_1414 [Verrucomicrobiota bacterium]|jgi:hypothetical protein
MKPLLAMLRYGNNDMRATVAMMPPNFLKFTPIDE